MKDILEKRDEMNDDSLRKQCGLQKTATVPRSQQTPHTTLQNSINSVKCKFDTPTPRTVE